ncbi:MAG TPA: ATP-dependent DNA helicase [Kineosporiaceae bacterium]
MPPDIPALLATAVRAVGGSPRPGQQVMAEAVFTAAGTGEHLLVQAGTGTGKSLAYLVPAIVHAVTRGRPVVVTTATLALQAQIVDRDLPRVAAALAPALGRMPTWQIVKGRANYLCRHKLLGGFPADDDALFGVPGDGSGTQPARSGPVAPPPTSRLGREIVRLGEWAESTQSGDRDELVPGVSDRAWRQVSVSAHECLGSQRCPAAQDCHSELARGRAHEVDVVVTNHAFMAIDAFENRHMLPEHDLLVVDEAHELADRVTSVISDELTVGAVEQAARQARKAGATGTDRLDDAASILSAAFDDTEPKRLVGDLPEFLQIAVAACRDAARELVTQLKSDPGGAPDGGRQVARSSLGEIFDIADRLTSGRAGDDGPDVVWLSRHQRLDGQVRTSLNVAPLSVAGVLRDRLYDERTVVLTSATLALGGGFEAAAGSVGLLNGPGVPEGIDLATARRSLGGDQEADAEARVAPLGDGGVAGTAERGAGDHEADGGGGREGDEQRIRRPPPRCRTLDVGSPFDYPRQGILYIARALPPPGREGLAPAVLDELEALVRAAGGRTLGLFSSRRAAEAAAEVLRERLDLPILCQGDDATPTLVREFARDAETCLFGTLSLWQGVDVPGSACQLVVIDRIPFPRPDDPLATARSGAVARRGGNGFMSVAATHAALRLAQGAGRLIRSADDRGVVAVLDSRLATARYGGFLRASLPPFWTTHDRVVALDALRRIDAAAGPVRPVTGPADRAETAQRHSLPGPASPRTAARAGRRWTPEEDAGLRAAVAAGRDLSVIAERYSCTPELVTQRLGELGVQAAPA